MKLNLILFKEADQGYIWQAYVDSMKHHIEKIWGWDLVWQKDDFKKALEKYTTEIIKSDDKQIGYVQYIKESKHIYINMIILQPDYQSQGFGATVLELIGSIEPGLPIVLKCFKINVKAYNFYLSKGFKVIKTDTNFYTLSNG